MATSSQPRQRGRPRKAASDSPAQSQNQSQSQPVPQSRARSNDDAPAASSVENSLLEEEDDPSFAPPVFYDTSFSAYRVSPLFIGGPQHLHDAHGGYARSRDQEEEEEEELSNRRLGILAQRLRDILVGDVVRGVEVGLGGDDGSGVMGRYGALERVVIRWFGLGRMLDIDPFTDSGEPEEEDGDDEARAILTRTLAELKDKKKPVLQVNLQYENSLFMALLLPRLGGEGTEEEQRREFYLGEEEVGGPQQHQQQKRKRRQFLDMPLLLLRMPPPLKSVIADFLATSFDCRVSPLRLGTRTIVSCLEAWFRTVGLPSRGPLAKDVVLWLGFYFPKEDGQKHGSEDEANAQRDGQLGLKTIDVSIPVSDLRRFVDAGRKLLDQKESLKRKSGPLGEWGWERDFRKRRRLAGRLYEEGWEWRARPGKDKDAAEEQSEEDYPFTEALGRYIDQHLGLNLFHPAVRVTKIGCGGFFMSEGKLKVFAPPNLGEEGAQAVMASSPGQRGGVLELILALLGKATISPDMFLR